MGLLSTIARALGLEREPSADGTAPPRLTEAAKAAVAALPSGHAVEVTTTPTEGGWLVGVQTVEATGGFHPAFDGAAVVATDEVVTRLRGLQLDSSEGRWLVLAHVRVRARETPNPNGRLYLADRPLSDVALRFGEHSTRPPRLAASLLARPDVVSLLVRQETLTVERVPDAPWDAIDAAVSMAIREHVLLCGGVLTASERPQRIDSLEAAVDALLDAEVRPALHADGGDLELLGIEDGIVKVHLVGACRSCPASALTMKGGVERALLAAFPDEVLGVEAV